jgi:hypothetical protein
VHGCLTVDFFLVLFVRFLVGGFLWNVSEVFDSVLSVAFHFLFFFFFFFFFGTGWDIVVMIRKRVRLRYWTSLHKELDSGQDGNERSPF